MKTLLPDLWTRDFMTDPFRAFERDLFGREFLPKLFEMPAVIFAITRAGLLTPQQLRRNRRYAIALGALAAAALPGDPITMLLEAIPLYLLFELSVLAADLYERRTRSRPAAGQPIPDAHGG